MNFLVELLMWLQPVAFGAAASVTMQGLKKASTTVDQLGPLPQRALVVVLAFLSTKLGVVLGVPELPTDVLHWDSGTVMTVLSAAGAFVYHAIRKRVEAWRKRA